VTFAGDRRNVAHVSENAGALPEGSFWGSVVRWLWDHVPERIRSFLGERFRGVTKSEAWGYGAWGAMGVVVGVPEIWAAISGDGFYWPTISSTIGHLEDLAAVVALAPVALLAAAASAVLRFKPGDVVVQADYKALGRTAQGRLATVDVSDPQLLASGGTQLVESGRKEWSAIRYFLVATLVVVAGSLGAAQSGDKWVLGYVLYSLIAFFWIVVPNWVAYWHRRDVPFTTLFFTVRCLERRLRVVALVFAAGIAILLIHLALYPWPDLARTSASYAGVTPAKAQDKAEQTIKPLREGKPPLSHSTQHRGISNGRDAWFVYFTRSSDAQYSGCFVIVTKESAVPSAHCSE
jgi:hypothetical protein